MSKEIVVTAGLFAGKPVRESIPVKELPDNQFEVLASPGFGNGFAAGDILEFSDSDGNVRVIKRGGNVCVQIFFKGDKANAVEEFEKRFSAIGGWLDGGKDADSSHLLIYTIPKTAGFPAIESAFENLPTSINLETWMYGNIYDDDGSPLNWWIA